MVNIKHIQQEVDGINWKCGQACLEMIFDFYNIEYDKNDIWENIKALRDSLSGQYFAFTYTLAKYAIEHGLNATVYRAKEETWSEVLKKIDNLSVPAILEMREQKSGQSHFVVYTGIKNRMYYYSDPNSEKEFGYFKSVDVKELWHPQPEINVAGYFFVVFDMKVDEMISCVRCGKPVPVVHSSLKPLIEGIACPHCGGAAYLA